MNYPREFPAHSKALVEVSRIEASRELERARTIGPTTRWTTTLLDDAAFHTYILRVFSAFAHEACDLGARGMWAVDRIRSETDEFLRLFTIDAYHEKGHDRYGRKLPEMINHSGGSLLPIVKQAFQSSEEWRRFEDELLAVAKQQAAKPSAKPSQATDMQQAERARLALPRRNLDPTERQATPNGPNAGESEMPVINREVSPKVTRDGDKGGISWKSVEICFLDATHAQVTTIDGVKRLSYAEMGFGDRRGMTVGDRGPNKAWGWLRKLAEDRGTINLPKRQRVPAARGPRDLERQQKSSHEVLITEHAGAAKAREKLQVAMKGLRQRLCSYFDIEDNPILFEETCYRAQFRVGLDPSYDR